MTNPIFTFGTFVIRTVMKTPEITGTENIEDGVPAIFISNHLGYFAPLELFVFTDYNYSPWVIHQITERNSCREYLRADFVEPTLHLKHPLNDMVAGAISPVCVAIMKHINAVPVYNKCKNIRLTVEKSIAELERGRNLLIFPESKDQTLNACINKFLTGFVNIARTFYERDSKAVNFYPVCVNKQANQITFGEKITFDPLNAFKNEKLRIIDELTRRISDMYTL